MRKERRYVIKRLEIRVHIHTKTPSHPPHQVLTSVGYLSEGKKCGRTALLLFGQRRLLHHNVFIGIMMRLLRRRGLGAAAIAHLLDEAHIQIRI
jgi:hypothetical protein